jgi:hypothetical protein
MIRPIDLQTTIISAQNTPAAVQRAEEGPRMAAAAEQAAFASEVTHRDESVAATTEVLGSRVDANPNRGEKSSSRKRKPRKPRTPFEQVVDEAAGSSDDSPHLVDFTA